MVTDPVETEHLRQRNDRLLLLGVHGAEAARRGGIRNDLLLEDVGHVHVVGGGTPGNEAVVAEDDERRTGQARADDVQVGCHQMNLVEESRQRQRQVRIVGQQGPAGRALLAADHPFVAAAVPFTRRHGPAQHGDAADLVEIAAGERGGRR